MSTLRRLINIVKNPRMTLVLLFNLFLLTLKILRKTNLGQIEVISDNEFTNFYSRRYIICEGDNFRERWTRATSLAKAGKYSTALALRKRILQDAKRSIGWESNAIPFQLESAFVTQYGHLPFINYVKMAAARSLIPSRMLQIQANANHFRDRPMLRYALQDVQVIKLNSLHSIYDHNAFFGVTEKVLMVTGHHDFLDINQMINSVETWKQSNTSDAFFNVVSDFEMEEFENLCQPVRRLGFEWFTCVQVRNTKGKDFSRNNGLEDFQSLFSFIHQNGGFVIIIGDEIESSNLIRNKMTIDMRNCSISKPYLTDLAIANARYFVGPDSGPTAIAVSLGVPTLRANGVNVLRNTYTTHAPSISLPKYWIDSSGNRLNWIQVIETDLGFCEEDNLELGYSMKSNSPEDLLIAFQELVKLTEFSDSEVAPLENLHLAQVKAERGGVGKGLLSSQFFK